MPLTDTGTGQSRTESLRNKVRATSSGANHDHGVDFGESVGVSYFYFQIHLCLFNLHAIASLISFEDLQAFKCIRHKQADASVLNPEFARCVYGICEIAPTFSDDGPIFRPHNESPRS